MIDQILTRKNMLQAMHQVQKNHGSAGIDHMPVTKLTELMSIDKEGLTAEVRSGKYLPQPILGVEIPKENKGGTRLLGIPSVTDRIAQMVVKMTLEPEVEPFLHSDSYGYRPGKSAIEAVGRARERCWRYDWVIDLDIKGFFDNLRHDLLLKALQKHTTNQWVLLYIKRWLIAPLQQKDGTLISRDKGTPQGSLVRCLLICTCITQWMNGCAETIRKIPLKGIPMIVWCTAKLREKQKMYWFH